MIGERLNSQGKLSFCLSRSHEGTHIQDDKLFRDERLPQPLHESHSVYSGHWDCPKSSPPAHQWDYLWLSRMDRSRPALGSSRRSRSQFVRYLSALANIVIATVSAEWRTFETSNSTIPTIRPTLRAARAGFLQNGCVCSSRYPRTHFSYSNLRWKSFEAPVTASVSSGFALQRQLIERRSQFDPWKNEVIPGPSRLPWREPEGSGKTRLDGECRWIGWATASFWLRDWGEDVALFPVDTFTSSLLSNESFLRDKRFETLDLRESDISREKERERGISYSYKQQVILLPLCFLLLSPTFLLSYNPVHERLLLPKDYHSYQNPILTSWYSQSPSSFRR